MQKIVFMGTPEFSVPSLEALIKAGHEIAAVVTPPDRPAGRGRKLKACPVKEYAIHHNLSVLQPEKLKNPKFLQALKDINPDIIVVVAFRMLPEAVWALPKKGTFNLHSSLLPDYRGAAPMNHAIINGETKSGVTTFLLDHEIDTGKILFREEVPITKDMNVGDLHDKLMIIGADLVVKTVDALENSDVTPLDQKEMAKNSNLNPAPKFTKEDLRIDWKKSALQIHNFVRGLSPYPAAFTTLKAPDGNNYDMKVYETFFVEDSSISNGIISSDGKKYIHVGTADGTLGIEFLQLAGKKRMNVNDFLRGFEITDNWTVL